jgi:DNA (cytosine-5)-methyltransferase 1
MNHGSLFSGIGGFDLATDWLGWRNVFHVERNPFCLKILKHYWPNADTHTDITTTDFTQYRGRIDVLSGGFPCQPFSVAGNRAGTADARYLWPAMLSAARAIRPRWIVGENVFGLVSWSAGLVFEQVCADLENEGYEVLPVILPACGVNAPHRRYRIFFIAHANERRGSEYGFCARGQSSEESDSHANEFGTNADAFSGERREGRGDADGPGPSVGHAGILHPRSVRGDWKDFPTQPPVCLGNDRLSTRLDRKTFLRWRKHSIEAAGNAVVPQVVYQIFKAIEAYDII